MVYEYLISSIFVGLIWLILYLKNKNLRKQMIFGSSTYIILLIPTFLLIKLFSYLFNLSWTVKEYWNPKTLFNLGEITGGFSLEDLLLIIFFGGIANIIYRILFKKRIIKVNKRHYFLAFIGFIITSLMILFIPNLNAIYNLIIPSFIGFLIIMIQRPDLFKNSIFGGVAFLILFFLGFIIFNLVFPDTIEKYWNLSNLSGILIFNIPVEELLYALSFGLMWAPMYEYVKGIK